MIDPKLNTEGNLNEHEAKEMEQDIQSTNQEKIEEAAREAQDGLDQFAPDSSDFDEDY